MQPSHTANDDVRTCAEPNADSTSSDIGIGTDSITCILRWESSCIARELDLIIARVEMDKTSGPKELWKLCIKVVAFDLGYTKRITLGYCKVLDAFGQALRIKPASIDDDLYPAFVDQIKGFCEPIKGCRNIAWMCAITIWLGIPSKIDL